MLSGTVGNEKIILAFAFWLFSCNFLMMIRTGKDAATANCYLKETNP
jgi:hypothetical protein